MTAMANPFITLSPHEASLLVWAVEQLPVRTMRDAPKAAQLYSLYEKLHLFADRNDHVIP